MLPIYAGLNSKLETKAQKILKEIIEVYMNVHRDGEMDFSDVFPEVIYFTKRDRCDKAVEEIYLWSRDLFRRDLLPLHEYALYNILRWAEDIEKDYRNENKESLFFNHLPQKLNDYSDKDKMDWELSDLGSIYFYMDNCFEDLDFLDVHLYLNMLESVPLKVIENYFDVDLNRYTDLLPPEIEKKLNALSADIKQSVKQKDIIDYDVFLSHSNLDKKIFVSELSNKLEEKGLKVFEDVKVFKIGQSQTDMMNMGILNSRFVVIFLSPNFIRSGWSEYEFKSFLNREINEKKIIILPIWHNVSYEEVRDYNPVLVDKFALDSKKYSLDEIVESIYQVVVDSKNGI